LISLFLDCKIIETFCMREQGLKCSPDWSGYVVERSVTTFERKAGRVFV